MLLLCPGRRWVIAGDLLGSHSGASSSLPHCICSGFGAATVPTAPAAGTDPAREVTVCNNLLEPKQGLCTPRGWQSSAHTSEGWNSTRCMGQQLPDIAAGKVSCQGAQLRAGPEWLISPWLIQDSYSSVFLWSTSSSFQPLEFFPNLYTSRRPSTLSRISLL